MDKQTEFLSMLDALVQEMESPEPTITKEHLYFTEGAKEYCLQLLLGDKNLGKSTSAFTEKGAKIFAFMKNNHEKYNNTFNAKTIGDEVFMGARVVSGAMRKLVTSGYVEKIGANPVAYSLTKFGLDYCLEEDN